MKKKRKIHKDKNGHDFVKEAYFDGGKMKIRRIYVIDGIPANEFYEKNATDIDHFINEEYWLISSDQESSDTSDESYKQGLDLSDSDIENLPF